MFSMSLKQRVQPSSESVGSRPIVVTFDDSYVRAATAMLRSLARVRAGKPTTVIALVGGVSPEHVRALSTAGDAMGLSLSVRDVSQTCRGLPYDSHGSPAVYYRLFMGEVLPEFSSVLYVDSDTIFLSDPAELLTLDFDPYPIAAVQDLCVPTLGSPDCLPGCEFTSAERDLPYFNSGLMVVDLDRWRRMGIGAAAVRFATDSPQHVRFWDQDALNAVIRGNWHRLDRRWNVFPLHEIWSVEPFPYHGEGHVPRTRLEQLSREAFLIHFVTRHKPWTHDFPPGRLRDLWLAHDGELMKAADGDGAR
jgi:lipopolysaccharide biosynthesis glycosyltransferase